ncbi:hypothetical protein UCRPC4_g00906 [Phaeomoniella chlamydospora]|uniref:Aminoglycoside phosphotransferase domain-containing protein n=1 Tax=Phaeomoniella chlamydospora TaxID=158046 RepID=A0A0G2EYJ4_PHACM|nr:hypothetical protein UCRPC4_g00906 [Phaeomoniella chlamydospora]
MAQKHGLDWERTLFGLEPRWILEPNCNVIEALARQHLSLSQEAQCTIKFYTQGAFNKLYKVDTGNEIFLMRVSLPVDPSHKTLSEVATIDFAREEAEIPVPRIIAFDASLQNELGFEWILMEMMPGKPLRNKWRTLSIQCKENIIKQLARYQARLYRKTFKGIGNVYERAKATTESTQHSYNDSERGTTTLPLQPIDSRFFLGRIVSLVFFWGDHVTQSVSRGPFQRSHDWLYNRLILTLTDQERILKETDDEDDIEDAETAKQIAQKLLQMLPQIFPPDENTESTFLYHDDLSMQNILVDDSGNISAIVDWECVSALPLWRACQIPALLEGRDREQEPRREDYSPDEENPSTEEDGLDNEGVNSLYWEHLLEYEKTHLRRIFMSEIEKLQPSWVEENKKSKLKMTFEYSAHNSDNGSAFKIINRWLNAYERGEDWSLRDALYPVYDE